MNKRNICKKTSTEFTHFQDVAKVVQELVLL